MIMEAKKPHSLPFVSWRHKNVHGVVLVQDQRSESKVHQWFKSKGKRSQAERIQPSAFLLYSGPQRVGWYPPTHTGEANLRHRVQQFKC